MENTKKCTKCGKELPLDQFRERKYLNGGIGHYAECKDCSNKRNLEWRKNNPEKERARAVKWQKNNPYRARKRRDKWSQKNPGYFSRYEKRRKAADLNFKLTRNIRAAIGLALRRGAKYGHTIELLGCSIEYLRIHLENQFTDDMNWGNYGARGWHIDHIIPLSYFDMSDPEQQKRAWHYTNLRPLWAKDNIQKSNKIIEIQLVLL